jgi:hypothetical protein
MRTLLALSIALSFSTAAFGGEDCIADGDTKMARGEAKGLCAFPSVLRVDVLRRAKPGEIRVLFVFPLDEVQMIQDNDDYLKVFAQGLLALYPRERMVGVFLAAGNSTPRVILLHQKNSKHVAISVDGQTRFVQ